MWLEIETSQQLLINISHHKIQQNLSECLWKAGNSSLIATYTRKLGFIMDYYDLKSEVPYNYVKFQ
jgi:hypothetical protein